MKNMHRILTVYTIVSGVLVIVGGLILVIRSLTPEFNTLMLLLGGAVSFLGVLLLASLGNKPPEINSEFQGAGVRYVVQKRISCLTTALYLLLIASGYVILGFSNDLQEPFRSIVTFTGYTQFALILVDLWIKFVWK